MWFGWLLEIEGRGFDGKLDLVMDMTNEVRNLN